MEFSKRGTIAQIIRWRLERKHPVIMRLAPGIRVRVCKSQKVFADSAPREFGVIADFVFKIDANTEILKVRIPPRGGIHVKGQ